MMVEKNKECEKIGNKKIFKKNSIFLLIFGLMFLFVITVQSVSALTFQNVSNVTGGSSFRVNTSSAFVYNISVNNTYDLVTANVTAVNITLPSSFTFITNSNATNAGTHIFSNTSNVLSWYNATVLIANDTNQFWFNATAPTPGTYNISVSQFNGTGVFNKNLSVVVIDTTPPSLLSFLSPLNRANLSQTSIFANLSATDNLALSTFRIYLFNSTGSMINNTNVSASSGTTATGSFNFTNLNASNTLPNGMYYLNATVNDTSGNQNLTSGTITFTLDTVKPTVSLVSIADGTSSTSTAHNFTFDVTDTNNNNISSCVLIVDGSVTATLPSASISQSSTDGIYGSGFSAAAHTWNINCTDFAGNVGNSSIRTFTVTVAAAVATSSGGGSAPGTFWTTRATLSETQITNGYTATINTMDRVKFKLDNVLHEVGVVSMTTTSAKINVSSTPQQAVFNIGDTKKFDLTNDNYYDLQVILNNIKSLNANLTIIKIHELISTQPTPVINESKSVIPEYIPIPGAEKLNRKSSIIVVIVVIIILIAIVAAVLFYFIKKRNNYGRKFRRRN